MTNKSDFIHLHVHDVYSFLDGAGNIKDNIKRAKELGMDSLATTNHNHIGGWYDFQIACNEADIKPILGCCLPEQIIYTNKGPKEIKDIKVGDMVLTHNGRYKKVLRHWNREFEGTLYGINSWNSNIVWLTDEHPVYTKRIIKTPGKFEYKEEMQWLRADEIKIIHKGKWRLSSKNQKKLWEHYSVFPKTLINNIESINIIDYLDNTKFYVNSDGYIDKYRTNKYDTTKLKLIKNNIQISKEFMKLIGYFLAEGSYYKKDDKYNAINFTFNINEKEYISEVQSLINNVFNIESTSNNREYKTTCDIYASSVIVASFFNKFLGESSKDKYIPNILLQQSIDKQIELLKGIENGDGKITNTEVHIKLANKNLIYDIKQLLANLGYASSITKIKDKEHYNIRYTINKESRRYYHEDDNYIYTPIKEVLNKQYKGLVYNFEVEDDNSYVTDITLHNCEMYQTWNTDILSKSADERRQHAIDLAAKDGIEIPEKINGKKATKKQLDDILKPYLYDTKQYHLIILAMNQQGMNNLIKLQSEAAQKCTYNARFCCDFEMLEKYNEGLIVMSACLGGMIPNSFLKDNDDKAYELANKFKDIFGDRFYLEIQPLAIDEQKKVNIKLVEMSKALDIKLVATNDVHYTNEEDWDDHDTLLCVGIGKSKDDENRMHYEHEFWVRSKTEMEEAFYRHTGLDVNDIRDAIGNTKLIADRIEKVKLGSEKQLFPDVFVPKGLTSESYLTLKSYQNLYKYKNKHPEIDIIKYEKRLYEELDIINSKGYAPYMLKIFENVDYCEENDIPVGPGRGSAAGSLCLFVNGGTKVVDPIKYNLLFFRFLTKDRMDPPDVDSDFSYYGRDKLIKHLEDIHGQKAVCHIGTYTEMGIKSGLKDFGRVLGIDFFIMNNISKKIDEITEGAPEFKFKDFYNFLNDAEDAKKDGDSITYNKLIAKYNEYKALEDEYPELFRLAKRFEGTPRNMGVHASGILVMPCNVTDYFPTRTVDGVRIALLTGPQLESLGAIKLDILGLKTLDVLDKTLKSIDPKLTVEDLYTEIENKLSDKEIFSMVQNKETEGIFQMESDLFKMLVSDIQPTNINDITAILSIG